MGNWKRYRKFIVALLAAAAVIGAELPADAPGWLTGTFAVLGAFGVLAVRNDQPNQRVADEVFGPRRHPPGRVE